jgi:hypothetical protein
MRLQTRALPGRLRGPLRSWPLLEAPWPTDREREPESRVAGNSGVAAPQTARAPAGQTAIAFVEGEGGHSPCAFATSSEPRAGGNERQGLAWSIRQLKGGNARKSRPTDRRPAPDPSHRSHRAVRQENRGNVISADRSARSPSSSMAARARVRRGTREARGRRSRRETSCHVKAVEVMDR